LLILINLFAGNLLWKFLRLTDQVSDVFRPDDNIHLKYLSIPLLLRVNAGKILTLNAGPQYSVLINNHKSAYGNVRNAFKSGDFSLAGGLQLNIEMLSIYGRYTIGVSDVSEIRNQDKWKSQSIQFGLGILSYLRYQVKSRIFSNTIVSSNLFNADDYKTINYLSFSLFGL
jgi:hypothetical protein